MAQSNDLLSTELNKWTKSMLVDFIITQSLPTGVKLSEELSTFLKGSSSNPTSLSSENSLNVATILQSVVDELKSVALSNSKLHDKLNRLNTTAKVSTSPNLNTGSNNLPTTLLSKLNADTHSRQPAIQSTASLSSSIKSEFIVGSHKSVSSKLSSVPVRRHIDIFVSRLEPCVTTTMLESELFNSYSDVTINKLVTKHPSYSSFHVRLPAEKLDEVLKPTFWPDGVMVKRFWGRLTPEMILSDTPKN
ncbi:unnamed protein product [Macrosiphum euphorbiae]|uniref:Uncharacterized protein n=1 Tax=Macrosiphum euphorbiae TaxID=13131 RepID=A0AAV0XJE1_9HEMI|nr:unnamed protein product [Macrosiphum euphorbiae]CAI6367922.1 unnamed protein product [Macrosiphum euphorbiae]